MKFVKVINKIIKLSPSMVVFEKGHSETGVRRIHDNQIQWKKVRDKIFVRKEIVEAYGLATA